MVEVVNHELHNLWVVAEVVGDIRGIIVDCLELDSTGLSFLSQVNKELGRIWKKF
jgi:hypothetical protein